MKIKHTLIIFISILISACGGGSSSDNTTPTPTPAPTPAPQPTVNLNGPNSSVYTSVEYEISWTSSNTTSCNAEGSWSGEKSLSGQETFSNAQAGIYTYTLECTGNGGSSASDTVDVTVENNTGTYYRTLTTTDGEVREFIVYVPESASVLQNVPVVFVIHGTGSNGQEFYDHPEKWTPKADAEGFIAVYPTALVHCHFVDGQEMSKTKWASGNLGESDTQLGGLPLCTNERLAKDMEFFDEMVDILRTDYSINDRRIYVTGNSNGAGMGLRLAAERSDIFAAVAVNAGSQSPFLDNVTATRPMSIMVTVGTNDNQFAQAINASVPIPIEESLINSIENIIQPALDVHALDTLYEYSESSIGDAMTGEFLFSISTMGNNNSLRFMIIEGFPHSYSRKLVAPHWGFLKEQSLP